MIKMITMETLVMRGLGFSVKQIELQDGIRITRDLLDKKGITDVTEVEFSELVECVRIQQSKAMHYIRETLEYILSDRYKAKVLKGNLKGVRLGEGLIDFIAVLYQRGYSVRAIERGLEYINSGVNVVVDSTIIKNLNRYDIKVLNRYKKGQVVELLRDLNDFDIVEFRRDKTDSTYELMKFNCFTKEEKLDIERLMNEGYSVDDIVKELKLNNEYIKVRGLINVLEKQNKTKGVDKMRELEKVGINEETLLGIIDRLKKIDYDEYVMSGYKRTKIKFYNGYYIPEFEGLSEENEIYQILREFGVDETMFHSVLDMVLQIISDEKEE